MQAPFSPILTYFNIVTEYHVSSIAVICLVFEALELALLAKSAEENLFHLDIQESESLVQYLIGALLCLLYQRSFRNRCSSHQIIIMSYARAASLSSSKHPREVGCEYEMNNEKNY